VLAELLELATWSGSHFEFHHFRDRYDSDFQAGSTPRSDGSLITEPLLGPNSKVSLCTRKGSYYSFPVRKETLKLHPRDSSSATSTLTVRQRVH
jgi:hypothetical protein